VSCVAWVAVDVAALGKPLAYEVPESLSVALHVGSEVRVPLRGRKVRGWVLSLEHRTGLKETEPSHAGRYGATRGLERILAVSGKGLDDELVALCRWAAWRWAGPVSFFLDSASPHSVARRASVTRRGSSRFQHTPDGESFAFEPASLPRAVSVPEEDVLLEVAEIDKAVLRLGPRLDPGPWLAHLWHLEARHSGRSPSWLVLAPTQRQCERLQSSLVLSGVEASQVVDRSSAKGASVVIGTRGAVWTPLERLTRLVVLGSHDPRLKEERAPTWDAWVVASRRAEQRNAACLLVSPCPMLQQLHWGTLVKTSRAAEREGWAPVIVEDLSRADPRQGLVTEGLLTSMKRALVQGGRVVAVLNRKGRARRLVCRHCRELVRCNLCGAGMEELVQVEADGGRASSDPEPGRGSSSLDRAVAGKAPGNRLLGCPRCGQTRPWLCASCGRMELAGFSPGVTRLRELLQAALRIEVAEVSADKDLPRGEDGRIPRVIVGTEAVLHRVGLVDLVAFLDFDSQLLAPGWRTNEKALGLLALGISRSKGSTYVQTAMPHHPVVRSCVLADPGVLAEEESRIRKALSLPPYGGLARLSGPGAAELAEALSGVLGLFVAGPDPKGAWLVKASSDELLSNALSSLARPKLRCRIEVDPL